MGTEAQEQSRTPDIHMGRGGVWLPEGCFAEEESFEWYLWLRRQKMCDPALGRVIFQLQKANHEERERLARDFPRLVAAIEAPDWCRAPVRKD